MSFLFAAWRCCYGAAHVEPRMGNSLCAEFHIGTQSVRNRAERAQNMTKPALIAVLLWLLLLLFLTSRMGVLPLQYSKCDVITRRWPCWTSVSIVFFKKHNSNCLYGTKFIDFIIRRYTFMAMQQCLFEHFITWQFGPECFSLWILLMSLWQQQW